MTTSAIDGSQRKAAKIAGLAYLLSFVTVVSVNFGIFERLVVGADPAQTARNILAHETLFRVGLAGDVLYCMGVLVLSAALYIVLKPVDHNLALLAIFGRLIHGLTWLLRTLNLFTALRLLSRPDYARAFPPEQLPVLARLYLSGFDQYYVGLLFWSFGATAYQGGQVDQAGASDGASQLIRSVRRTHKGAWGQWKTVKHGRLRPATSSRSAP